MHSLFEIYESIPSTMDVARQNVLEGALSFDDQAMPNLFGVLASEQTEGRGQRGRTWFAKRGASLCATFYYSDKKLSPSSVNELSLLSGVAIAQALSESIPDSDSASYDLGLKWPNDLLLNGRKLGGILIEMVKAPSGNWVALIGVGINLNIPSFPPILAAYATSLSIEGIVAPDSLALAESIAFTLRSVGQSCISEGFESLCRQWKRYDRTLGRRFEAQIAGETLFGTAKGVTDRGFLILQLENGATIEVQTASSVKEVVRV